MFARNELQDSGYRIIFSGKKSESTKINQENFHHRTNPRDISLDNFHGDALINTQNIYNNQNEN